jgi:hypothetical protein
MRQMADNDLADLIRSPRLDNLNPRDTITQIKAAAIRQFEALDGRMRIHSTEYFNHSFAPDLVLNWRTGREVERYVYMRSGSDDLALKDDVRRLGSQRPIVLGLAAVHRRSVENVAPDVSLNRLAEDYDTLVTDPEALASVAKARKDRPVTTLFSTALAQGGKGVLDSEDAATTTDLIAGGFEAAREMGAESVLKALTAVDAHLAAPFASRFNRVLQAVWIGSGGRADLFPQVKIDLAAGVDDEALEFLLDLEPIEDPEFWRRIGRSTTVKQIGHLTPRQPNENLQWLIKANLDHLSARVCRVQDRQEQFDDQDQPEFRWLIERNALALRSHSWIAYVAEKAEELGNIEGTPTDGVSINDLIGRATGTTLVGLQMSDGTYELDLTSSGQADVAHSDHLDAVSRSFGPSAKVLRARALTDNRQVACDFTRSAASTTTSSIVQLRDLLRVGLPLLRPIGEEEQVALVDLLEPLHDPGMLALDIDLATATGTLAFPDEDGEDYEPSDEG